MSPRRFRTQPCDKADAAKRLADAVRFLEVAHLTAAESDPQVSYGSVTASLAVLAGIAAADAVCCAALGERSRGQSHHDAEQLVEAITPGGKSAARALRTLINLKDTAQYGFVDVSADGLRRSLRSADQLIAFAERIVRR